MFSAFTHVHVYQTVQIHQTPRYPCFYSLQTAYLYLPSAPHAPEGFPELVYGRRGGGETTRHGLCVGGTNRL